MLTFSNAIPLGTGWKSGWRLSSQLELENPCSPYKPLCVAKQRGTVPKVQDRIKARDVRGMEEELWPLCESTVERVPGNKQVSYVKGRGPRDSSRDSWEQHTQSATGNAAN